MQPVGHKARTGHEYHQYYCTDDSLDIPDNQINDLFRDSQGRLWVVTVNGTSLYTDKDNFQNIPLDFPNKNGIQILENKDGKIFLNMMHNLAVYNPQTHKFDVPIKIFDPNYTFNNRCFIDQSNKLWAVTPLSLRRYNSSTLALEDSIPMQGIFPTHFFMHTNGILWLAGNRQITLFDTHTHKFKETPQALRSHPLLLHANVNYIHPTAEYRPTRNVSLQLRGRIRDTSERKRFSLRSASLQDKHHVYRLTEKPVDRLCRPRLCRALQL